MADFADALGQLQDASDKLADAIQALTAASSEFEDLTGELAARHAGEVATQAAALKDSTDEAIGALGGVKNNLEDITNQTAGIANT